MAKLVGGKRKLHCKSIVEKYKILQDIEQGTSCCETVRDLCNRTVEVKKTSAKQERLRPSSYIMPVINSLYLLGIKRFRFLETFLTRRGFILQNNLKLIVFKQQMDGLTSDGNKDKFRFKQYQV